VFNMMMAIGQAERQRNRGSRMGGKLKRARMGEWVSIAPFGYDRDDLTRRLVPNDNAPTVREIFRLRAEGVGFSDPSSTLPERVALGHPQDRHESRVPRRAARA
jgi:DNA invertase Pin-like site-specific DNA recombinase